MNAAAGKEPEAASLGRAAAARGHAALSAGDKATAIRWFDRAARVVPSDAHIKLSLAAACIGQDDRRAETLFQQVAEDHDRREAWFGLAAARFRLGDMAAAASTLASVLARHAPWPGVAALASEIVRAAGAPGWCGLNNAGVLTVQTAKPGATEIRLDDRAVSGPGLPAGWDRARSLSVTSGGRHLLGSPIDIAAIRRVEGCVDTADGGLRGWAWHPNDPDTDPELTITAAAGRKTIRIVATEPLPETVDTGPMARARAFSVAMPGLHGLAPPFHVRGANGRDLMGSPLDPGHDQRAAMAAAAAIGRLYSARTPAGPTPDVFSAPLPALLPRPAKPVGLRRKRPEADIVIPVYGGGATTLACVRSVIATISPPNRIVVVDDASPDLELGKALEGLHRDGAITLLRNPRNLGFSGSVNAGLRACADRDVVLLNSDTLVPPGWLERLRDAAYSAADIGTVTPFSNSGSILSYPGPAETSPGPDLAETIRLDHMARKAGGAETVDIPVGVGFCLYVRRDCLDTVGLLRADIFAQGYGEENDFCLRAHHLGWRNVALPGLFVAHRGGSSFGAAGRHLRTRNATVLENLHPGYHALIAAFQQADTLAPARRRLDQERWRAARTRGARAAIIVTHDEGGGVELQVAASVAAHQSAGRRAIVLRPARTADDRPAIVLGDGIDGGFPNLVYAMPSEQPALLRLLAAERPETIEVHHLLGHDSSVYQLMDKLRAQSGIRCDVHIHDYAWFCPRVLLVGGGDRYCGEPDLPACEACVADNGSLIGEPIGVAALRDRSARFLADARLVVVPSDDTALRMRRHFPTLLPHVVRHEDDDTVPEPGPPAARNGRCVVCVVGGIGVHKGYNILLACARDAAARRLPLDFILVGSSIDDGRLLDTGRVFITGSYERPEAVSLIRQQNASLALVPSVSPETWCLGLTDIWQAGLQAAVFDLGAPAERVRRTGRGIILPSALSTRSINNALLAAVGLPASEGK